MRLAELIVIGATMTAAALTTLAEGPVAYKQPPKTRYTTYTCVYQW
jgi:hypothetical protein